VFIPLIAKHVVFPRSPTQGEHLFGKLTATSSKMYRPTSVWAWAFLMTACFQALFAIIVDSFLLYKFDRRLHPLSVDTNSDAQSSKKHAMSLTPTYLIILVLGLLYHASLSWDTLRLQNTVQICGVCSFAAAISAYSLAEVIQIQSAVSYFSIHMPESGVLLTAAENRLLVAIPIVLAITTLVLCVLAWKLSQLFAWTVYKSFSADMDVRKRYMLLEVSDFRVFTYLPIFLARILTVNDLALYRTAEIRLLLLSWLRGTTSRHSRQSTRITDWEDRVLSHNQRCSLRDSTAGSRSTGHQA
jgi:hypothetical protein